MVNQNRSMKWQWSLLCKEAHKDNLKKKVQCSLLILGHFC
nr:hypothetical protein Iba_chr13fCG5100 [Ipomoea batatas]